MQPAVDWKTWYDALAKPSWTPEPATIGLVWRVLYPVILVSFGYVFWRCWRGDWPREVALPFALNLAANLAFTPLQFGLRSNPLAALDILVTWGTLPWMMVAVWPHAGWVALAQLPYFCWVSLATYLQLWITWHN